MVEKKVKYFYYTEFGEINEVAIYKDDDIKKKDYYFIMYCGVRIKTDKKDVIFNYYEEIKASKKRLKFIHLSRDLSVKQEFVPRIPVSRLDEESDDIKRICVAQNISDAFSGMHGYSMERFDEWGYNQFVMYEIIPDELGIKLENIILNEEVSKHVEDAEHTNEFWITQAFEVPFEKISGVRIYEFDCETKSYEVKNSNLKWSIDCFNITKFETFNLGDFYSEILKDYESIINANQNEGVNLTYCILSELFNDYYFARNMKVEKTMSLSDDELKKEIESVKKLIDVLRTNSILENKMLFVDNKESVAC